MESTNYSHQPAYTPTTPQPAPSFPAGRRELVFAPFTGILCLFLANCVLLGGFNLGFTLSFCSLAICGLIYLGRKLLWSAWGVFHLICVLALAGLQSYSNDGTVKFIALCAMLYGWYQALALLTGNTTHSQGDLRSLGSAATIAFSHSFRELGGNLRGLVLIETATGVQRRKVGAIAAGLALSFPVLLVVVPLLVASDAAFEGLMEKVVFFDLQSVIFTLFFGLLLFLPVYSRSLTLRRQTTMPAKSEEAYSGRASAMTLNTILITVSVFYLLYLLSQLAYFFSGFSGILPEGFTSAEYARRGFFEMCILCAINLGLLGLFLALVRRKEGRIPLSTRLLSHFVCLFCLVLVCVSVSKMSVYISTYGLTRLRVLTTIFDLCVATSIVCVALWLLWPRFPYMKVVVVSLFLAVILTGWLDVDTQVARYNTQSYQSGKLETIDLETLSHLSSGSTASLVSLLEDENPEIVDEVQCILARRVWKIYTWQTEDDGTIRFILRDEDFRGLNVKAKQEADVLWSITQDLVHKLIEMGYMDSPEGQ